MSINRRQFLSATAMAGMATAVLGLAGCSPEGEAQATEEGAQNATVEHDISETKSADVVVVGGGMSGLAAAVSASDEGASVILLEVNQMLGGNGVGTEGIFAAGSKLQKEQGIDITFSEIIASENVFFNYRINTLLWKDMVEASADNLDWLMGHGVLIDHVDNYRGSGSFEGFHWWGGGVDNGYVSEGGATNGYITPMSEAATAQGVEILTETRGLELIMQDGKVAGIIAQRGDESWLQIDCKAVILATGGYADSDEKLQETGIDPATVTRMGMPGHMGDGLDMAVMAGGVDSRSRHGVMREPGTVGYDFGTTLGAMGLHNGGPFVFVNGDGDRFTNENCITQNPAYIANAVLSQPKCFAIANQGLLDELDGGAAPGIIADTKNAMETGAAVFTADTLDELAAAIGADAETLNSAMERYNGFCKEGTDEDFAKDSEMLIAMEDGPFFAYQLGLFYFATMGGIATNRNFEVVDAQDTAIPGLWAVGTDGCELYRETYTVMVPASAMANNINSGRHAGAYAAAYSRGESA